MKNSDVRTFRAESMQAALDLVRQELGSDAVILHTRELPKPSLLFRWRTQKERIEVTASNTVNVRPQSAVATAFGSSKPTTGRRDRHFTDADLAPLPASPPMTADDGGVVLEIGRRGSPSSRPIPPAQPAPSFRRPTQSNTSFPNRIPAAAAPIPPSTSQADSPRPFTTPRNTVTQESLLSSPLSPPLSSQSNSPPSSPSVNGREPAPSDPAIVDRMASLERAVAQLVRSASEKSSDIPPQLFQAYTGLIDAEVDDAAARDLVCRVKDQFPDSDATNAVEVRERLARMIELELRIAPPIRPVAGRRRVVALVGPTGVGKTTTIAKLAANFRLREQIRMGLVTVDTYRIAAVEQLRTYAEIIDLPMKVVTSPREMNRALSEFAGLDLVLIDTAGRSPRDELKIQELKLLLAEAHVDEVHLVLSVTSNPRSLAATANHFVAAGVTSLLLTKLDEAAGPGTVLTAARQIPLPISYITTGQDVPDDIEPANARRLSHLILGIETLTRGRNRAA